MMMVQAPLPIAVRLPRRRAGTEATPACPSEILRKTFPIGASETSPQPGLMLLIGSRFYRQPSAGATWVRMLSMAWAL